MTFDLDNLIGMPAAAAVASDNSQKMTVIVPAQVPAPMLTPPVPRLVITPSTPRFPEDIFSAPPPRYTHSNTAIIANDKTDASHARGAQVDGQSAHQPRPMISRSLSYEVSLGSFSPSDDDAEKRGSRPRPKRSSSYPSPHLLTPPLPLPKSGHRPLHRSPIISCLFLLLGLVLVLSSALCGTESTARLLALKQSQLEKLSEAGRLLKWRFDIVMETSFTESDYTGSPESSVGLDSASTPSQSRETETQSGHPCEKSKAYMSTKEWRSYVRHQKQRKGASATTASLGFDLWDF